MRIDAQQADAVLACDVVVAASADALQTVRHGRTRVLANRHEIPVAESLSNPDAEPAGRARCSRRSSSPPAPSGSRRWTRSAWREEFLGDTIVSNIVAMGYAWQRGLVPVGLAAMQRAIELNGVAVESQQGGVLARPARRRRPGGGARAAARARPGDAHAGDARRADRALGALPRRLPERGLRRALSPRRSRRCARASEAVRRRRRGAAADARRRRAAAKAHGLQGRVRGRPPLHRRRVRQRRSPSSSRATTCASSSTWRRRRW